VSLDSSGDLLYRRSEKERVTTAPLRETLASLILMEARLDRYDVLLDPMCGSGTFSLEGAGIMLKRPAGARRDFAFTAWPAFSEPAFNHMKKSAPEGPAADGAAPIVYASDSDPAAVEAARENIEAAGLSRFVDLQRRDFFREPVPVPPGKRCLVAVNPPYGRRLGDDSEGLYRALGACMRRWYGECGYAVITPSLEHEKILSLGYDRKISFVHGGIRVAVIIRDGPGRP
jgi:putative N6-adenine-specific DNA methylase